MYSESCSFSVTVKIFHNLSEGLSAVKAEITAAEIENPLPLLFEISMGR